MAAETHRFENPSEGNSQVINLSDGVEASLTGGPSSPGGYAVPFPPEQRFQKAQERHP